MEHNNSRFATPAAFVLPFPSSFYKPQHQRQRQRRQQRQQHLHPTFARCVKYPHVIRACDSSSSSSPRPPHHHTDNSEHDDSSPSTTTTTTTTPTRPQQSNKTANTTLTPELSEKLTELEEQLYEMDRLAESWIGTDLARWEWYERLRSRRERLLVQVGKDSARFNEDLEQLQRILMEFDAVMGTNMLDQQGNVSPAGWTFLTAIAMLYVSLGYAVFHGIVAALMAFMSTNTFP